MGKNINDAEDVPTKIRSDFVDNFWEKSWTYMRTWVDVDSVPILILDENFYVMAANDSFYSVFKVEAKDTEQKIVYEIGNGQWNIPALRKLLEAVLPKNTYFKGFEVAHNFPTIGRKNMILNARQMYVKDDAFPPIIFLAIEDVTKMMDVAEMLAIHTKQFEKKTRDRIEKLEAHITKLEQKIHELKDRPSR